MVREKRLEYRAPLYRIEQTGCREKATFIPEGSTMQITNRLLYWLFDRYFERVAAFLEHRAAAVPLNPSLQTSDKTIR